MVNIEGLSLKIFDNETKIIMNYYELQK